MALRAGTVFHGTVGQPTAQVIDGSLRFNGVNQHLTKTFGSGGNRRTFTLSYWIKEHGKGSSPTNNPHILWSGTAVETRGGMVHRGTAGTDSGRIYMFNQVSNTTDSAVWTDSKHRDFSAWKHVVFRVDSTISSPSTNRVRIYINGVVQDHEYKTTPAEDFQFQININQEHRIGRGIPDDYGNFSLSQYYFIDGQALGPEYFAFTDPLTNTWRPKKYTGTFGTTGFWLPFDGNSPIGQDKSGNGNDWTTQNFSNTSVDPDILKDSPSGAVFGGRAQTGITTTSSAPANYPTLSPLTKGSRVTLSDGNLDLASSASSGNASTMEAYATFTATSGKFYAEVTNSSNRTVSVSSGTYSGPSASIYSGGGQNSLGGTASGSVPSFTTSDFMAVAIDYDDKNVYFYKNNTLVYSVIGYTTELDLFFADRVNSSGSSGTSKWNFGQRPFRYAPPQGFLALNSASARPNTVITRPDQYVGVTTYKGTGNPLIVSGLNMKPDFIWIKNRTASQKHTLVDSVRTTATGEYLASNDTAGQGTGVHISGVENGISIADPNSSTIWYNDSSHDYVAWSWKAGGKPTATNTQTSGAMTANSVSVDGVLQSAYTPSGSPSKYPKKMSIGTKQGFSIVQFEGTGANATIPHGLGKPAKFMIVKNIDEATGWGVYHDAIGTATNNYIELQSTGAAGADDTAFQDTAPTSDVFSVGSKAAVNDTNDDSIAYIWADVPGLQKFGKYTGNGDADGPFIELGFRPAVVITKRTDTSENWEIRDSTRNPHNRTNLTLFPHSNTTEDTGSVDFDLLSNGFKLRNTNGSTNADGGTYIYCAWAEQPASNLFGGQSNAR